MMELLERLDEQVVHREFHADFGSPPRVFLIFNVIFDSWNLDHKALCNEMTIVSLLKSLEFKRKRVLNIQKCLQKF